MELAAGPKPPVQRSNVLSFDKDGKGVAHISQLKHLENKGAIVLNTLGTDGQLKSETLTRLPAQVTACASVSLINYGPGVKDDSVAIVIDKAAQRSYNRGDLNQNTLPAIIERKKESIPTFVTKVDLALDIGQDDLAIRALLGGQGGTSSDRKP